MEWIVVGRAEIETTGLGRAAFDGEGAVDDAIRQGIDWGQEGCHPLHGALYGRRLEIAVRLLQAGSPIGDATYWIAFDHLRAFLDHLPPRPDLIARIEESRRWPAFAWALVREDIATARELLARGVPVNGRILLTHGMGALCPIHYAARNGNLELLRLVVEAGADVNALTDRGRSPLRMLAENAVLSRKRRLQAIRFLRAHRARCIPAMSRFRDRLRVRLGWPIEGGA